MEKNLRSFHKFNQQNILCVVKHFHHLRLITRRHDPVKQKEREREVASLEYITFLLASNFHRIDTHFKASVTDTLCEREREKEQNFLWHVSDS